MKKVALIISLLLFLLPTRALAQESLQLAAIPYQTRNNIDLIFQNSTIFIDYLEGENIEKPLAIAIINQNQADSLLKIGLRAEILDTNSDIQRYVYLYNQEANQANKLASFGEVFAITPYHTILKVKEGVTFNLNSETRGFSLIPIVKDYKIPPFRQEKVIEKDIGKKLPVYELIKEPNNLTINIILGALGFVFFGLSHLLYKKYLVNINGFEKYKLFYFLGVIIFYYILIIVLI